MHARVGQTETAAQRLAAAWPFDYSGRAYFQVQVQRMPAGRVAQPIDLDVWAATFKLAKGL
jgi:hypothetical protein